MKAIANFLRLQDRYGLAEGVWLEIKKQGYRDYLKIADSIRGGHWRTGEHARAPGLLSQSFGKHRRKLVQFIHVLRVALERERGLPRLLKIAIVNLRPCTDENLPGKTLKISESSCSDVTRIAMQAMVSKATLPHTSARRWVMVRAMKSLMRMNGGSVL